MDETQKVVAVAAHRVSGENYQEFPILNWEADYGLWVEYVWFGSLNKTQHGWATRPREKAHIHWPGLLNSCLQFVGPCL